MGQQPFNGCMNQHEDETTSISDVRMAENEREQCADVLAESFALGRLTKSEFDARLATVLTARTRKEADAALAGLPSDETSVATLRFAPPERHSEDPAPGHPLSQPQEGWGRWALTGVFCLVIWAATSLAQAMPLYFWPAWVIGPWGLVLLVGHWSGSPECFTAGHLRVMGVVHGSRERREQ